MALSPASQRMKTLRVRTFLQQVCSGLGTEEDGRRDERELLARCFLVYYRRFFTPLEMFRCLEKELSKGSIGAVLLLRQWIDLRFERDFRRDKALARSCLKLLVRPPARPELLNDWNKAKLAWIRCSSASSPGHRTSSSPLPTAHSPAAVLGSYITAAATAVVPAAAPADSGNVKILGAPPAMIAERLTLIDRAVFAAINITEFYDKGWTSTSRAPNLLRATDRTSRVSRWVASNVLIQASKAAQAKAVEHFIAVAHFCAERGNFAGVVAIMQGFNLGYVSRLFPIWSISHQRKILAHAIDELVRPAQNYHAYREALRKRREKGEPCVPYLGVYQKDLTFMEDGNPDTTQDGSINVSKMMMIGKILCEIEWFQRPQPGAPTVSAFGSFDDPPTDRMLRTLPCRDEAWLEARSEQLRPRKVASGEVEEQKYIFSLTDSRSSEHESGSGSSEAEVVELYQ